MPTRKRKSLAATATATTRYRCKVCGKTWTERQAEAAGQYDRFRLTMPSWPCGCWSKGRASAAPNGLRGLHRNTICKLLVHFGDACRRFLDERMHGLTLTHLQFDEQWTYVAKKQSRLTIDERAECCDKGDVYLWTCIDQKTKLLPSFLIGKRSADNARRFMMDVASRLRFPERSRERCARFPAGRLSGRSCKSAPMASRPTRKRLTSHSAPTCRYGTIIKEYKNASMIYTPSRNGRHRFERGIRGISGREERTICTSHVERLNGTQRLFMKRLNRLTLCFSKKLENLEAAFAMFAACYNFCWQTRKPGTSGCPGSA